MILLSDDDRTLMRKLLGEVSADRMQENWSKLLEFSPIPSGTPQEAEAVQYVAKVIRDYGVPVTILRFNGFVSIPKEAQLTVLSPQRIEIQCSTFRAVGSTSPEGVEGELIYIEPNDLGSVDCKDKIILTDTHIATSLKSLEYSGVMETGGLLLRLQDMGALGIVAIEEDSYMPTVMHQRADFSVSGNPTSENYSKIPKMAGLVHVTNADGQLLKCLCQHSTVRVRLKSIVDTGWKKLHLLVAEIKCSRNTDKFILVNGHLDTPPFSLGATDNLSGCAALIEMARVFHKYRDQLRRNVRIVFWTGHEIGRYAGSTWYNDNYWHDLRYNCVAFLNVQSPGVKGTVDYTNAVGAAPELQELAAKSVFDVTGQEVKEVRWKDRGGDCSFWGTGFPHIFIGAAPPVEQIDPFCEAPFWWWHTPWDTLDKVDRDVLVRDVKVNVDFAFMLCNSPILPMNFADLADRLCRILEDLQARADKIRPFFNLEPILQRAKEFRVQAAVLEDLKKDVISKYEKSSKKEAYEPIFDEFQHCAMWVSRHLNLVAHSETGKTEQISMEHFGQFFGQLPFPGLQPILELAKLPIPWPGGTPDFELLKTQLMRERNRVEDAFYLAIEEIRETVNRVRRDSAIR